MLTRNVGAVPKVERGLEVIKINIKNSNSSRSVSHSVSRSFTKQRRQRRKVVGITDFLKAVVEFESADMTSSEKINSVAKRLGLTRSNVIYRIKNAKKHKFDFSDLFKDAEIAVESMKRLYSKNASVLRVYMAELRRAGK